MFVNNTLRAAVLFYATATLSVLLTNAPAWALTAQVTPQDIPINLMYHGAQLSITGESDAHDDLIIKISSEPDEAHMKFKGKAAGLFWMKMGDISFEHVPTVYLLATSRNLDVLLPTEERVKENIGFESIKLGAKMESSASEMDPDRWIEEFIKFKKAEKLYRIQESTITSLTEPKATNINSILIGHSRLLPAPIISKYSL